MPYRFLPQILEQEGPQFYRLDRRWKPQNLIPDPYRRNLLKDAQGRQSLLEEAEGEFQTLTRATYYMSILRRMRLVLREAKFAWRSDDLKFLEAITSFFTDYGTILRNLRIEQARGRFSEPAA